MYPLAGHSLNFTGQFCSEARRRRTQSGSPETTGSRMYPPALRPVARFTKLAEPCGTLGGELRIERHQRRSEFGFEVPNARLLLDCWQLKSTPRCPAAPLTEK